MHLLVHLEEGVLVGVLLKQGPDDLAQHVAHGRPDMPHPFHWEQALIAHACTTYIHALGLTTQVSQYSCRDIIDIAQGCTSQSILGWGRVGWGWDGRFVVTTSCQF